MPFDLSTAQPVSGGFDLNSAKPVTQDQVVYDADRDRVLQAESTLKADEVSFLDETQNSKKPKGNFWGMQLVRGSANVFASTPQIVGSELQREADAFIEGYNEKFQLKDFGALLNPFSNTGTRQAALSDLYSTVGIKTGQKKLEFYKGQLGSAQKIVEKNRKFLKDNNLDKLEGDGIAFDIGSGASSIFTAIGLTFVTKNPAPAAIMFGEMQRSQSYLEAREKGFSAQASRNISNVMGGIEAGIELIGGKIFLDAVGIDSTIKRIVVRTANEAMQEGLQQAGEEAVSQGVGLRDVDVMGAAERVAYSALLGGIVSAPVNTIISTVEKDAKSAGLNDKQIKNIIEKVNEAEPEFTQAIDEMVDREVSPLSDDEKANAEVADIIRKFQTGEEINITEDERNKISQVGENKIIALENEQQEVFIKEAQDIKEQMDAVNVFDEQTPSTLKKILGYIPENLTQFIKRTGGITERNGELAARDINTKSMIGLVRKSQDDRGQGSFIEGGKQEGDNIDFIKERVFDAGYFPNAKEYNDISDSDLFDAIAEDLKGSKIYKAEDISLIAEAQSGIDISQFEREGFSLDMSVEQIADVLREQKGLEPFVKGEEVEITFPDTQKARKNVEKDLQELLGKKKKRKTLSKIEDVLKDFKRMTGAALTPISTRLGNISPTLKAKLRKFEFDVQQRIMADEAVLVPFLEKFKSLNEQDQIILDYAMKNGDIDLINEIAIENDMVQEVDNMREVLNNIYKRAEEVGLEVGYQENFFPRHVLDSEGLLNHFREQPEWNEIQAAIEKKELELGQKLTDEEKAHIVNTMLRGYGSGMVTLAKPSPLKERKIDRVTPEINDYYNTSDQALIRYVGMVNDAIEARRFFGKGSTGLIQNIDDSIGYFVLHELEKGTITTGQAQELTDIMKARFSRGRMSTFWRVYKNISYIDTMGSVTSAITQIGDLAFAMYKSGVYSTGKALLPAIAGKSKITKADLGVEKISQEFDDSSTSGKAVSQVFKLIGLNKMDAIGKETLINSAHDRYKKAAKKNPDLLRNQIEVIFEGETDQVIQDLQDGVISENVKLLLFNELLDMQPVALSEMPEAYLKANNGKIFYMLKSFTIKQIDVYRREVFQEIRQGNTVQGLKNLTRLISYFIMMNASADYLKDLILNRDKEPEDYLIDNILRSFAISKFQIYTARREGIASTAAKTILPPFKLIDGLYKDMAKAINDGDVDPDNIKSVNSVPFVGKFYYWWFGGGAEKESGNDRRKRL